MHVHVDAIVASYGAAAILHHPPSPSLDVDARAQGVTRRVRGHRAEHGSPPEGAQAEEEGGGVVEGVRARDGGAGLAGKRARGGGAGVAEALEIRLGPVTPDGAPPATPSESSNYHN